MTAIVSLTNEFGISAAPTSTSALNNFGVTIGASVVEVYRYNVATTSLNTAGDPRQIIGKMLPTLKGRPVTSRSGFRGRCCLPHRAVDLGRAGWRVQLASISASHASWRRCLAALSM